VIHPALSALRRTGRLATRRPRAALWTLLALSCALFAVAIAVTAAIAIDRFAAAQPGSGGNMVVYLGEGVSEARATALVRELRALRGVERAELVSGAESASRLSRALGSDPALLDGVDLASLPASVEVALAPGVREVVAMSPTVRALRGAPGVADVVVTDDEDERIAAALHIARAVAWTGAVLFAGLALLIVLAAVRLGLARSPVEAAVHRLLGAPPGFIAIPSALAGALQGTVAAVVAAGALGLVLHGRGGELATIELASPPAFALAGLVALGGLVGFIGGGLAGVARAQ
jgi:cell division transport system permease protein